MRRGLAAAILVALCADARAQSAWRSPAGLVYRDLASILARTQDQPSRRLHGVFHGDPRPLIDEAWQRVQRGGPGVRRAAQDDRQILEVDMGRPIGWLGGQVGAQTGHPAARYLRLVLDASGGLLAAYPGDRPLGGRPRPSATPPAGAGAAANERHVLFGLPSPAGRKPNDFLLVRERYLLSYNRSRKVLNWASWSLRASDFGPVSRQGQIHPDPDLPADWERADDDDFGGSGLTRGHIVAAGESTADPAQHASTNLFTNIIPQPESVNGGPWNKMENYYRDLVRFEGKEAYLIAGTIFRGPERTIGRGVHVPSAAFKIVVLLERGQTLADVTPATRVIAAIVPNSTDVPKDAPWAGFRTSVAEIERQTGLRFFKKLPAAVATALRRKVDREEIPDTDHPKWLEMMAREAQAEALAR